MEIVPASFEPQPKHRFAEMGASLNVGDVAHVQHSYAFFGGMRPGNRRWQALAAAVRRPLVLTVHELDDRATGAYHLPAALERAYKAGFNRRTFCHPSVRGWIVHSRQLRDGLLALGAPEEQVRYWRHPVATDAPPLPDAAAARERFGLRGKRVLTIIGFLARRKGYDLALEALTRLPEHVVLLCAGGEHAADATGSLAWLRSEAAADGLGERVQVTGYLSDERLQEALAATDLVLAPFREVSGSGSLALAMASRLPILAADLPPLGDIDCLARFPAGDAAALAHRVEELLGSEAERDRLREAAGRYAAANSYHAPAERTVALYRELL